MQKVHRLSNEGRVSGSRKMTQEIINQMKRAVVHDSVSDSGASDSLLGVVLSMLTDVQLDTVKDLISNHYSSDKPFAGRNILQDNIIYRVVECPVTNTYQVKCIGTECVDSGVKESYSSIDDMPDWFARKLAMLYTVSLERGSSGIQHSTKGVGWRDDQYTFWVKG